MESRRQPNLLFYRLRCPVAGQLGGYNFTWAWAGGYACAQVLGCGGMVRYYLQTKFKPKANK